MNMRFSICVWIVGLMFVCSVSLDGQTKSWRSYFNEAETLKQEGQYLTAARKYQQAAEAKPSNKELSYFAGKYFVIGRDYKRAITCLEPIKDKSNLYPKVLYYYGLAEKALGNYNEALEAFSVFYADYNGGDQQQMKTFVANEIKGCELGRTGVNMGQSDSFQVDWLGDQINSSDQEFAPIPINNSLLYFSSNRTDNIQLFRSELDETGRWTEATVPESLPLIRQKNYAYGSFSPDYTKFYFSVCDNYDGEWWEDQLHCEIYYSELIGGAWTEARALDRYINLPGALNIHPFVVYEGKYEVLYFVSDRSGGMGGLDIWYVSKEIRDGISSFGYPINAGQAINTASNEMSPVYDVDQAKLFFASDGWPSLGGMDVFGAVGSKDSWIDIQALPAPVNSSYDDYFYTPLTELEGYLVSNRPVAPFKFGTVDFDLFYFHPEQDRVDSINFAFDVMEKQSKRPVSEAFVEISEILGPGEFEEVESLYLRSNAFQMLLESGKEFYVAVKKNGYLMYETIVATNEVDISRNFFLEKEELIPSIEQSENETSVETINDKFEAPKTRKPLEYYADNGPKQEYRIQIAAVRKLSVIDINGVEAYGEMVLEPVPNKNLKRVVIGSFPTRAEAEEVLDQLKSNLTQFNTAFVVKYVDGKRS